MSYKVFTSSLFIFFLLSFCVQAASFEVLRDSIGAERKGNAWLVLHKVDPGESLTALARRYRTSIKAIQEENPGLSSGLKAGEVIKVPYTAAVRSVAAAGRKTHSVAAGQGLYAIARIYGVSVSDLRTWNGLTSDNLYEGQELAVAADAAKEVKEVQAEEPVSGAQSVLKEPAAAPTAKSRTHKVKRGEGLSTIAQKYKVSLKDIRKWNRLSSNNIRVGQVLRVSAPEKQLADAVPPERSEPPVTQTENVTKTEVKRKPDNKSSVKDGEDDDPTGIQARTLAEREEYNRKETRTVSNDAVVANTSGFPKVIEAGLAESISDSGGTEGYYALHRSAPVGTILQVRNEMNNLSVFVKVVGKLPDTGANDKLVVKITQKAYERLAAVDKRFRVEVTYLPN